MTTLSNIRKFLFIHIPKNAGTSMYHVWGRTEGLDWHYPAKVLITQRNPMKNYFKFAFVRNPWDRMWSFYHHVGMYHPEVYSVNFNDWLVSYDDSEDRRIGQTAPWDKPMSSTRRPQYYWISNDNDQIILDFVGRYENLQQDFEHVAKKIRLKEWGVQFELPHIRQRLDPRHYTEVYNEKGKEHVRRYFAIDIEKLGYEYGG